MAGDILVIGEALMDCVYSAPGEPAREVPGGSPLNVAIGLSRLGNPVLLATRVGSDERGLRIIDHASHSGVRLIDQVSGLLSTATASAFLSSDGSARYEFDIDWDLTASMVPEGDYLHGHTGSISATLEPGATAVLEVLAREKMAGASVSYDPNVRPQIMGSPEDERPRIEEFVRLSDIVKASDEDIAWLYPNLTPAQVVALWKSWGVALVVITRGAQGALACGGGDIIDRPSAAIAVVDTIGAGDTVMAGLLHALASTSLLGAPARGRLAALSQQELADVVDYALRAAAITVSRPGADPPYLAEM
jgi:fructokinase